MKNIIYVLAGLATVAGLRAEEPASNYSITTDFTYTSEYIFRGVENSGAAFQPSVELTSGNFNVGLWTSQPVINENNEIDVYAGYSVNVNSALKVEGVLTTYWYPEASTNQTKSTYEAGVGATYTVSGFSPSLYYYHDFRLESNTLQAAVGYSLPLEVIGASVDTSAYFGTNDMRDSAPDAAGASVRDSYTYWGVDASIPFKINKSATFTVGGHFSSVNGLAGVGGPTGTLGKKNLWFTTGISIGF